MSDLLGDALDEISNDPEKQLMLFSTMVAEADEKAATAGIIGAFRGHGVDPVELIRENPDLAAEIVGEDVRDAVID